MNELRIVVFADPIIELTRDKVLEWICTETFVDPEFIQVYDGETYDEKCKDEKCIMVGSEPDYTEIADERIRGIVCELMSEMLDNPDEYGIYPTGRFMWKMERFILDELGGDCSRAGLGISEPSEHDEDYYCLGNGDIIEKRMWMEQIRKAGFYPVSMSTSLDDDGNETESVTLVGNTRYWKPEGFLDAEGIEELEMASLMLLVPLVEKDMTIGQKIVGRLGKWVKSLRESFSRCSSSD